MDNTRIKRVSKQNLGQQPSKSIEQPKILDSDTTFEELCSKKLIQPGMTVTFSSNAFGPIHFEHNQTGVEQVYTGEIHPGIVVHSEEEGMQIVTLLSGELHLKGRFGRVFYSDTLKEVVTTAMKTLYPNSNLPIANVLSAQEFDKYLENGTYFSEYFFTRYRLGTPKRRFYDILPIALVDFIYLDDYVWSWIIEKQKVLHDSPDKCYTSKSIMISIKPNHATCCLKPCKKIITIQPASYGLNHYPFYLELGQKGADFSG